jgi:predicted nucleotidyltransferase/uncharacterized protein (UPF0332 family)
MTSERTPTELINSFTDRLKSSNPNRDLAVILIGSVARNVATSKSDLDLLVIGETEAVIARNDRLHVQFLRMSEFLERLRGGDDFAAWCVRYGIPIVRTDVWDRITQSEEAKTWPNWRKKIEHATRRLLLANDLLAVRDEEAAAEELTYAVSHVGRAILLSKGLFPLSRPEMITQLADVGYSRLSEILEELSFRSTSRYGMRQAIRYLKKLLICLDREGFEKYVRSRKEARAAKRAPVSGELAS